MKPANRRKCPCCKELFRADPRNRRHQQYCSKPDCRKASKAASQGRWLAKPANQDYFPGPVNVKRVRAWRETHPAYSRGRVKNTVALQDHCRAQAVESKGELAVFAPSALQDVLSAQPLVLIGLIAHLTGTALQDEIDRSTRQLLKLGEDILGGRGGDGRQAGDLSRTGAAGAGAVQLGGP